MNQLNSLQHQFPELTEAIANGYCTHFLIDSDGLLYSPLYPAKHYGIDEVQIRFIRSAFRSATLYIIETIDGLLKGTLVEYWECQD